MRWDYGPLTKAKLQFLQKDGHTPAATHTALVNPSELSVQVKMRYAAGVSIGQAAKKQQFVSSDTASMNFTLHYDGFLAAEAEKPDRQSIDDPKDVSPYINELVKNIEINSDEHQPATCRFTWGSIDVYCQIRQMRYSYTMFTGDGKPIRARVQMSVDIIRIENKPKNSPDRTKWRKADGEASLWRLAYHEYGDAEQWRVIAAANGIRNPRPVCFGTELRVPAL